MALTFRHLDASQMALVFTYTTDSIDIQTCHKPRWQLDVTKGIDI